MSQLFISYARENRPDVEALVRDLQALGHQTWLDTSLRGGQSWWHEILQRIADSDVFVAIVSGHTLSSVACKREREWALALNKPVLPLAVDRLPDALPRDLSMRQIVDYSKPGKEAAFALAGALGTLPAAPPPPEQLPEPPAAPLSYLSDLVEQVAQSEPLTQQQQHQILIQLEPSLRSADAEERRGGRYVLKVFSRRGDLYADVDRTLSQLDLTDDETERSAQWVPTGLDAEQLNVPLTPAKGSGNLLTDPGWADALSAYFAKRWDEAVERLEMLQVSHPGEGRVETKLKDARRQRDIGIWSAKAETSAADGDWDAVVTALETLTTLDPDHHQIEAQLEQARMSQRRNALADEATALHKAGRWDAVMAAARELADIDPDNADPGGVVSDARAKIHDAELADKYAQALNQLDQEHWQQAGDLLAAIEQEQPGYRDAVALLATARQRLDDTQPLNRMATPARRATPPPQVAAPGHGPRGSGKWIAAAVIGVALAGTLILAVVQSSKSSDTSASMATSTTSTTTTSALPTPAQPPGPNDTMADYLKKNHIELTPVTPGTPGAPSIDFPVPDGWARIPPDGRYFGIAFNTPANPDDRPTITATLEKLAGNAEVDPDALLTVAPREIKRLPGFTGSDCTPSPLAGHPACQVGGSYTRDGMKRVVAQKTVVIQSKDATYIVVVNADGLEADTAALNDAAGVIDAKTAITP